MEFREYRLENGLEIIAECRRTESFADVAEEADGGRGESRGVAGARSKGLHELLECRAGVAFPERDAAVEEADMRVAAQDFVGRGCGLRTQKNAGIGPTFRGKLGSGVYSSIMSGGRQAEFAVSNSISRRCRRLSPASRPILHLELSTFRRP